MDFINCDICNLKTTRRTIMLSRRIVQSFNLDLKTANAILNISYLKIYKKNKMHLCKHCFKNMSNRPSFSQIMNSQVFGRIF